MINFHEVADIILDVKKARGWRRKLFFVFASPIKIAQEKQQIRDGEVILRGKHETLNTVS
ncbi:hypothetical protein [Spirosoma linguale]|uniref:Uncharacterized protein n=1 Tax=Spirosoma linguale (strain ATCC 33905 / DSM 74 / LMG 10896 / Claus 1) TaxID=504472 RepID=D2QKN6_SPILD|nr:hypothetical protein Slin_4217 [Spirosoma linguale DSM 74]